MFGRIPGLPALLIAFCGFAAAQPTYFKDISRIVQVKCQGCHRPNDIAPFALLTYDDATTYSDDVRNAVANKIMPPWKPVPGYDEYKDSYGLSDDQRQAILDWIDAGMPPGDPADAPDPLPVSDSPWQLGTPDLVLQMPQYTPPRRADTYRCFSLPTGLDDRKWINAAEAIPGVRQEVHHILLFLDQAGESAALDGQDGDPGYDCFGGPGIGSFQSIQNAIGGMLGAWVPGMRIRRLDDGIGTLLPGKSRVIMQVHYHPSGRPTQDQTQVGFYFAPDDSVQHRLLTIPIVNTTFQIPPGESSYPVTATFNVPFFLSAKAVLVGPHMHLLGRTIKVELRDAAQNTTPLIYIDNWDFNWQGMYTFVQPIAIPGSSTVTLTSVYDNSDGNPKNPNNPLTTVGWGEGTNDEMCLALIGVILDNDFILNFLKKKK